MRILHRKRIPLPARIKLALIFANLNLGNAIVLFFERLLFRKVPDPRHILIFRTGSLGDNVCAIPSIAAIRKRYPDARLDILVNSGASNLVSLEQLLHKDYYDEIINYLSVSRKEIVRLLRERKYDLVIQLPQTGSGISRLLRDLFFFRLISKGGFGWRISSVPFFRRTQEKYVQFDNETKRLGLLMQEYGIPVDLDNYQMNFTEEDNRIVDRVCRSFTQNNRQTLAFVVGAKRPQNRWPAMYFEEVINEFRENYNILLVGGSDDTVITNRLQKGENIFDFCGKLTPVQSALLLKKCILVLSNDTGPMHLAYAVGTPLVAIFSSRDFPGKWFPPDNSQSRVYRSSDVHCSLCLSETCADNICMQLIKPSMIINQMKAMLKT